MTLVALKSVAAKTAKSKNLERRPVTTDPTAIPDAEIVDRVRAGDDGAFRLLVERYSSRIYTLVASMVRNADDVEDVVQDVFFKAYRKIPGFEGKSAFYTWLYRVAFNTATDCLKRKRNDRTRSVEDPGHLDVADESASPTKGADRVELRRKLAEAITDLPTKYRDILVLPRVRGLLLRGDLGDSPMLQRDGRIATLSSAGSAPREDRQADGLSATADERRAIKEQTMTEACR